MYFGVVQLLGRVCLFAAPWTAARQASLPFTISQTLLKLMSIESVIPPNHLILCRSLLLLPSVFPSIRVFSDESVATSGGQSIGSSALASILLSQSQFPPTPVPIISIWTLWICLFQTCHGNGIMKYVTFCTWLLSFSIRSSGFLHTIAPISISLLFVAE